MIFIKVELLILRTVSYYIFIQNIKRVTCLLTGGLYSCSAESDGVSAIVGTVGGRL